MASWVVRLVPSGCCWLKVFKTDRVGIFEVIVSIYPNWKISHCRSYRFTFNLLLSFRIVLKRKRKILGKKMISFLFELFSRKFEFWISNFRPPRDDTFWPGVNLINMILLERRALVKFSSLTKISGEIWQLLKIQSGRMLTRKGLEVPWRPPARLRHLTRDLRLGQVS